MAVHLFLQYEVAGWQFSFEIGLVEGFILIIPSFHLVQEVFLWVENTAKVCSCCVVVYTVICTLIWVL